jgi:arylsulfatase A-like enzyme
MMLGEPNTPRQQSAYIDMRHCYLPFPGWRAVRTDRWLYARTESAPWVLFDLENDPLELENLVDDNPARRDELDALLQEHMKENGDQWRSFEEVGDFESWPKRAKPHQSYSGDWPGRGHVMNH